MFARIPMYDRAENHGAHDALWAGVRAALGYGIADLGRDTDYELGWGMPDLLFGQICCLLYRAIFDDRVTRIASADYGLPDTPAGYYHSLFVVRAVAGHDLRDRQHQQSGADARGAAGVCCWPCARTPRNAGAARRGRAA